MLFINEANLLIEKARTLDALKKIYNDYPQLQGKPYFMNCLSGKRKQIEKANADKANA